MQLNAKARLLRAADAEPTFLPDRLVMLDCEMSGLDPKVDELLQIAAIKLELRDGQYRQLPMWPEFNLYIKTDLQPQNEFHRTHLADVYRKCNASTYTLMDAKPLLEQWMAHWLGKVSPCGDCVPTDVLFMYMKGVIGLSHFDGDTPVDGTFFYEYFDANSIKAVARQKAGRKFDRDVPRIPGDHDALVDCKNQLAEMNAIIGELMR